VIVVVLQAPSGKERRLGQNLRGGHFLLLTGTSSAGKTTFLTDIWMKQRPSSVLVAADDVFHELKSEPKFKFKPHKEVKKEVSKRRAVCIITLTKRWNTQVMPRMAERVREAMAKNRLVVVDDNKLDILRHFTPDQYSVGKGAHSYYVAGVQ